MQTSVADCHVIVDFYNRIVGMELSVRLFVRFLNTLYAFNTEGTVEYEPKFLGIGGEA